MGEDYKARVRRLRGEGAFARFPLVRLGEREAYFNGLTPRREGEDSLSIYLVLVNEEGPSEKTFSFRRVTW